MAARQPQPLRPHILVSQVPSHGVTVFGGAPSEVLGLEEMMLRGHSRRHWLDDGTDEYREMAARVQEHGHVVVKKSRL